MFTTVNRKTRNPNKGVKKQSTSTSKKTTNYNQNKPSGTLTANLSPMQKNFLHGIGGAVSKAVTTPDGQKSGLYVDLSGLPLIKVSARTPALVRAGLDALKAALTERLGRPMREVNAEDYLSIVKMVFGTKGAKLRELEGDLSQIVYDDKRTVFCVASSSVEELERVCEALQTRLDELKVWKVKKDKDQKAYEKRQEARDLYAKYSKPESKSTLADVWELQLGELPPATSSKVDKVEKVEEKEEYPVLSPNSTPKGPTGVVWGSGSLTPEKVASAPVEEKKVEKRTMVPLSHDNSGLSQEWSLPMPKPVVKKVQRELEYEEDWECQEDDWDAPQRDWWSDAE